MTLLQLRVTLPLGDEVERARHEPNPNKSTDIRVLGKGIGLECAHARILHKVLVVICQFRKCTTGSYEEIVDDSLKRNWILGTDPHDLGNGLPWNDCALLAHDGLRATSPTTSLHNT